MSFFVSDSLKGIISEKKLIEIDNFSDFVKYCLNESMIIDNDYWISKIKEYSKVFHEYFMTSFSSRLAEYSNPIIEVNSKEKINENYTIVSSTLVATEKRPEIKIEWRIYTKNPDKPLIRDLIIEGLSLARTQKEEFNSIIQGADGDIEALLANLKNFSNE